MYYNTKNIGLLIGSWYAPMLASTTHFAAVAFHVETFVHRHDPHSLLLSRLGKDRLAANTAPRGELPAANMANYKVILLENDAILTYFYYHLCTSVFCNNCTKLQPAKLVNYFTVSESVREWGSGGSGGWGVGLGECGSGSGGGGGGGRWGVVGVG